MALEVLVTRYFQMAALGADKRPVREGNHRHELLANDTIRAPNYSLAMNEATHTTIPLIRDSLGEAQSRFAKPTKAPQIRKLGRGAP